MNPSYMHTFAVTDHYIVLIEQCLCISLVQMVQVTLTHGPMTNALIWHGNEPVRFRLIHRDTMREQTNYIYLSPAFFFLHIINAYEHGESLVIDICCYENADMLKCMTIEALQVIFRMLAENSRPCSPDIKSPSVGGAAKP